MKQTAVEWIVSKLSITFQTMYSEEIEQAKAMEKDQHGNTWDSALEQGEKRAWNISRLYTDFDDYYNEQYGDNK